MIIHRPAAVRDHIIEFTAIGHMVLILDKVADIAETLPLAGQKTDPFQSPFTVFFTRLRRIFKVIKRATEIIAYSNLKDLCYTVYNCEEVC